MTSGKRSRELKAQIEARDRLYHSLDILHAALEATNDQALLKKMEDVDVALNRYLEVLLKA